MECDICGKALGFQAPCHCAVCVRSALYELRIEQATVLIEKEALSKHAEAVVKGSDGSSMLKGSQDSVTITLGGSTGGILVDRNECVKRIDFDRTRAEAEETLIRIGDITEKAEALKKEMEEVKKQMAMKRSGISQKRNDLSSATHGLTERRGNEAEKVKKTVSRVEYKSDRVHTDTVKARASLCREAAALHGLRRAKRKGRDGASKEVYYIGFNRIYDLRDLNTAVPDMLSASLENVARLVVQVSSYLAVRLPAEITLPHRDWPGLTIYSPTSSYHDLEVPFPASTSGSSSTSPSASRTLPVKNLPRPRPLFIDRQLPQLFKEDPKAYNVFVEGIGFLAYNVAWLCRVQGMLADFSKLEEMCAIGRNLHFLLFRQTGTGVHDEAPRTGASTPSTSTGGAGAPSGTAFGAFGEYSHGTAHSFLSVAHDPRGLKIMAPFRLIDAVKSTLVNEMQSAEWEVVDEQEWNQMEDDIKDDPVLVGTKKRSGAGGSGDDGGRGALSTIVELREGKETEWKGRGRGINGWMKLKSRSGGDPQSPQSGSRPA